VMRHTKPEVQRPFRTPWVPTVPILGMITCLGLMAGLGGKTWLRLIIWLAIGMVIYLLYSVRNSRVQQALAAGGSGAGR